MQSRGEWEQVESTGMSASVSRYQEGQRQAEIWETFVFLPAFI